MKTREEWGTRIGFILATVGSAVGLGNIWRFPYQVYENRGGVFLLAYLFALFTAGIPLLILEFGLGHKFKGAAPSVFARLSQSQKKGHNWEWLGWFQTLIAFFISTYYTVIIGWTLGYFGLSFFKGWGTDTNSFFNYFLGSNTPPVDFFHFAPWIPLLTLLAWIILFFVLIGGIKRGIEKANKIFMPVLIILILVITIRGLFLEGATVGLNNLFNLNFSGLTGQEFIRIGIAAYGQIFFSMSVGFAVMISYSSYLPKKSDIVNNAFITGLLDCGFSIISGIMIFSILGNMAYLQGVDVGDVAQQGSGLAFIAIPTALNSFPGISGQVLGALFFLALAFAGLSSAISVLEATISAIVDKFNISRTKVVTAVTVVGFSISILFSSRLGVESLSITDSYINNIAILCSGITEIILLAWIFDLKQIKQHVNLYSDFKIGKWWNVSIAVFTPITLFSFLAFNIYAGITNENSIFNLGFTEWKNTVDKSQLSLTLFFGWGMIFSLIVGSIILQKIKGSQYHLTSYIKDEKK